MGGAVDDFYAVDHRFDTGKCILRVGEISVLELYGAPSAEVLSPNPSPRFARPDETVLLCCDAVPWRLKKAQDSLLQSYPLVSKRRTLWTADDSMDAVGASLAHRVRENRSSRVSVPLPFSPVARKSLI